MCYLSSRILS